MNNYKEWAQNNLGTQVGNWYSPFLEKLGWYLKTFGISNNYNDNFFEYDNFDEFSKVYLSITKESEGDLKKIIKGINLRYPKEFSIVQAEFEESYQKVEQEQGKRGDNNYGGIPRLGTILRSYLKYLYYIEHPNVEYPKKNNKIETMNDAFDDSLNYWVLSAGQNNSFWESFRDNNVIGIGWNYLGNLNQYHDRDEIKEKIAIERDDGIHPKNDSLAVWEFKNEIEPGDVVYVKLGTMKILAKGTIVSDYIYDESDELFKHKRNVKWSHIGEWELRSPIAQKTLTHFNKYKDWVLYADRLLENEEISERETLIEEYKIWLNELTKDGYKIFSDSEIDRMIQNLEYIEVKLDVEIIGVFSTPSLNNIRDQIVDLDNRRKVNRYTQSINYYIKFVESKPLRKEYPSYSRNDFLEEVFINPDTLTLMINLLDSKKNLILQGAPGVGKTFIAEKLAYVAMGGKDDSRIEFVQFHQNYSYEDFIEGFRPTKDGKGFELRQGPFVKFARKAAQDEGNDYFFIIDEINRGNLSKILGELMMLIEHDKRGKSINLLYSNEEFSVPSNLYIIGMMNTADRSLALLDYALRRRFSFLDLEPIYDNNDFIEYIEKANEPYMIQNVIEVVKELNIKITDSFGKGFRIGHSYFIDNDLQLFTRARIKNIVLYDIVPQLEEYWFDDTNEVEYWTQKLLEACV